MLTLCPVDSEMDGLEEHQEAGEGPEDAPSEFSEGESDSEDDAFENHLQVFLHCSSDGLLARSTDLKFTLLFLLLQLLWPAELETLGIEALKNRKFDAAVKYLNMARLEWTETLAKSLAAGPVQVAMQLCFAPQLTPCFICMRFWD